MRSQQYQLIWIASAFSILIVSPSWASEAVETQKWQATLSQTLSALNEINQPATTLDEWRDQIAQTTIVPITGIRLSATDAGVEVILETADGQLSEPSTSVVDNTLIVEIPNAVLALPDSNEFQQTNPAEGITLISINNLMNNRARVAITGLYVPPTVEVRTVTEGLVLSVAAETDVDEEAENEIQIIVTGEQDRYAPDNATTATRTDTPIRNIPQSIQIIPRQVLEDQQLLQLEDAIRNVSGIVPGNTFANTQDGGFVIRGFPSFDLYLRNGFRDNQAGFREFANVERVEVLKGPSSILYGSLEPGGVINLITARPLSDPSYTISPQLGSYGLFRPSIDFSGPLNLDRTLLYRFNALYQKSNGFRDFNQGSDRVFIAPVLEWQISDRTNLLIELDYLQDKRPFDRGIVVVDDQVANIPINRVLGEPDDFREVEEFGTGYQLEHQFSDTWSIRNRFRLLLSDSLDYAFQPDSLNEETGELSRNLRSNSDYRESYALQTELIAEFSTGSIEHTLLIGLDLGRSTSLIDTYAAKTTPSINIFNPVYGAFRPDRDDLPLLTNDRSLRTHSLGIFVQDQIDFADSVHLLIGGRFDIVDQFSRNNLLNSITNQYDNAFSPRIGLVYRPIEPISLYASYSRSFQPNFFTRADGSFLQPEQGTQYEIGIRGDLNSRLIANLAAYHLTKTNIATTDPNNPDFSLPLGEVRSQGIELDVSGEILPGWNLIASYGYTDAEVTKSDDAFFPEGLRNANVPRHTASLWTTYEIQQGDLQGLGFGIGLFYVGERPGDFDNTYNLPDYLRTDAAVFYRRDRWRAAINIRNLFDIRYFEAADFGRVTVRPGEPLTVVGTVTVEF